MVVLVGYASASGSTRGVAERIAARITEHGCAVDCRPVDQVKDPTAYAAFVLGSAVHSGAWLPSAADFLRRNVDTLIGRAVWLFRVSSVGEQSSAFAPAVARRMRAMRKEPKGVAEARTAVMPRDHHDFAGVVQPRDWGLAGRVFMTAMMGRYGDHRNWAEIDAWARDIARQLPGTGTSAPRS